MPKVIPIERQQMARTTISLSLKVANQLQEYCVEHGLNFSEVVRLAVAFFLREEAKKGG